MSWPALALAATVTGASMRLEYVVEHGVIVGQVTAPRGGWVAVGFNDRPTLDGSALLMAAITPKGPRVEEHVARPPLHGLRTECGGVAGLVSGELEVDGAHTVFRFRWTADSDDGWLSGLGPDAPLYITLAWSRETDFQHHSAERELLQGTW